MVRGSIIIFVKAPVPGQVKTRLVTALGAKVNWFPQEGRDLGERLIHATHRVFLDSSGPVIVIGSDLPALSPALLQKAFEHLKDKTVVLGPSVDGGYYLNFSRTRRFLKKQRVKAGADLA